MCDLTTFKCLRCGECCKWAGDVRITEQEALQIAEYLHLDFSIFMTQYVRLSHDRKSLALEENAQTNACIFFKDNPPICLIQSVKPAQCQSFPFKWRNPGWEKICHGAINMLIAPNEEKETR